MSGTFQSESCIDGHNDEKQSAIAGMESYDLDETDRKTLGCQSLKVKKNNTTSLLISDCSEMSTLAPVHMSSSDIKSSAVVKYTAVETPSHFLRLSSNTNLNLPPSNWLRGSTTLQRGQWPYTNSNSTIFSSFHMANSFPDCIGEVDVISDSENIKKLLKIPYSKSHISMMVHRIGKTLLLDEFDIHSHLLRASQKQWEWLRKFYFEHVLQTLQEKEKSMLRKKKSRGYLQNKNMFSKFLYYSLAETVSVENNDVTIGSSCNADNKEPQRDSNCPVQPFIQHKVTLPDLMKETEEQVERGSHEFLRNLLWTFEDITMLIGSDMPIFGGGTYPAVSLRLRDMQKPINVLTGLDYWLDNLMCNVPEVVMCYHLDGIVQKYELLKTEDIPQMKNSQFSPTVVKDVAQNILSFLKSNATKSGHTYWLFKGKNDEVVKLYDLTTLCSDIMDDQDKNPFRLPVAVLLYRVACNMNERPDGRRRQGTIYKLLKNCLCLLNSGTHPQIETSVHYLLSNIYVPGGLEPNAIHKSSDESESSDETNPCPQCSDEELEEDECDRYQESPSVDVKAFCIPNRYTGNGYSDAEKAVPPLTKNWEERCHCALNHVVQGFRCILDAKLKTEDQDPIPGNENQTKANENIKYQDEGVKMAKPFHPIPLHYSPINTSSEIKQELSDKMENQNKTYIIHDDQGSEKNSGHKSFESKSNIPPLSSNKDSSWKVCCSILLLQKAAQSYATLSEAACEVKKYGQAMQHIKYGIICYVYARKLVYNHTTKWPTELLSYLLSLAGDIHFMLIHGTSSSDLDMNKNDFDVLLKSSKDIQDLLERGFQEEILSEYSWAYEWPNDLEGCMNHSATCYEMALKVWPGGSGEGYGRLIRRWGNICNELGVFYMNQAARIWNDTGKTSDKITELWNKSKKYLTSGIHAFESVSDAANIALLNSNTGRLMRLWAHSTAPYKEDGTRKEFSIQERQCYNKAIHYYNEAVQVLVISHNYPEIWDSVNWEFSTTLFNMACLMQDFAPLSSCSQEEVEGEISDLMKKALKLCETNTSSQRQPVYHYRSASIHHRLASLYHNAYRNQARDDHRCKQLRLLADLHYSKSCSLFSHLEHCTEYLRVLLERIGLWEHHFSGLVGFSSKVKTLHSILACMISAKPVISLIKRKVQLLEDNHQHETKRECTALLLTKEEEEEKVEQEKLLLLLEQRLQHVIRSLIETYSSRASKQEKILQQWNQVSSSCIRPPYMQLEEHLNCLLGKLEHLVKI